MDTIPGLATVVIPVFGGERYIGQALASALAQTYQPLEVIVIDDGSPDASAAICKRAGDPRVGYCARSTRG